MYGYHATFLVDDCNGISTTRSQHVPSKIASEKHTQVSRPGQPYRSAKPRPCFHRPARSCSTFFFFVSSFLCACCAGLFWCVWRWRAREKEGVRCWAPLSYIYKERERKSLRCESSMTAAWPFFSFWLSRPNQHLRFAALSNDPSVPSGTSLPSPFFLCASPQTATATTAAQTIPRRLVPFVLLQIQAQQVPQDNGIMLLGL